MRNIIPSIAFMVCLGWAFNACAESIRVHVYPLSQQYWDVRPGDTLGQIVESLVPADRNKQRYLMRDIVELNPDAFLDGDPNRLRANVRLWLPNVLQQPVERRTGENITIERYEWGSIKRVIP
ncbi:MAG TPA: hypothetical protein VF268_06205 [Gammaproteobacteria bacterium]|jgi:hypothetical protein